ncbi:MAG: phage tail protein [Candidatus Gastranaerophilales bacterium]|nr:phage tail protein [Candidatus Gastranaerophilales bacterium]
MTQKYYSIMTTVGTAYINEQVLNDSERIFADGWYMKLGNGTAEPDANMTDLSNVIYTKTAADYPQITFGQNPDGHYAEMLLPESLAGQLITEAGLFNADDVLIAVAKTKIDLTENGSGLEMSVKQRIFISAVPASVNVIYMAQSDLITEDFLNETLTAYEPIAKVISKGSASLPVYFDSNGEAQTISSYQGNAATATYANAARISAYAEADENGRNIKNTYATRDLGGLTADGDDYINQSKALYTGEISDNAKVFADIKKAYLSTFDITKFTVIGSPTIDNGVVSGFASGNNISTGIALDPDNNTLEIDFPFTTGGNLSTTQCFANCNNAIYGRIESGYIKFAFGTGVQPWTYDETIAAAEANTKYILKLTYDLTTYKIYLSKNDNSFVLKDEFISSSKIKYNSTYPHLYLGTTSNYGTQAWLGGIDLKDFRLQIGGGAVFSGMKTGIDTYTIGGNTVKIPYTVTKGGAKIAEAESLNDIKAVYNNGFVANQYFTIDKFAKTFTLPQGLSVYEGIGKAVSDISKLSKMYVVETYTDGKSGYIVYNNKFCKQWGYVEADNSDTVLDYTVNMFKTFANTDFHFRRTPIWANGSLGNTITSWLDEGYLTKTTTSVTFTMHEQHIETASEWEAFGYIA